MEHLVQNTTYHSYYPASKAIDGNNSTFSHTAKGKTHWLDIIFPSAIKIVSVDIINRSGYLNGNRTPTRVDFYDNNGIKVHTELTPTWNVQIKEILLPVDGTSKRYYKGWNLSQVFNHELSTSYSYESNSVNARKNTDDNWTNKTQTINRETDRHLWVFHNSDSAKISSSNTVFV